MSQAERITDPNHLRDYCGENGLLSLSDDASKLSSELASKLQQVELVILQPLANTDMVDNCRDPESRVIRRPNGSLCGASNCEYLNLQPLSKSWRNELMKVPPISKLIFDVTLPKKGEKNNGSATKVYWDTAMPQEDCFGIHTRDVMTLVITIATETRMRTNGGVLFEVIYDDTEGISLKGMARLKKQLLALSNNNIREDSE